MKKLTHKQILAKEADKLWKQACLKRYGDRCLICGAPMSEFHHFIPKSKCGLLKYDIENGVPVCRKHHSILHYITKNPVDVANLVNVIEKKRGKEWRAYIDRKQEENRNMGGYKSIKWLEEQISKLEELLEN